MVSSSALLRISCAIAALINVVRDTPVCRRVRFCASRILELIDALLFCYSALPDLLMDPAALADSLRVMARILCQYAHMAKYLYP